MEAARRFFLGRNKQSINTIVLFRFFIIISFSIPAHIYIYIHDPVIILCYSWSPVNNPIIWAAEGGLRAMIKNSRFYDSYLI